MAELDGKAIVITGAGRGIGAACAVGLARMGALLVINDIDAEPAQETLEAVRAAGGKGVICIADITDWDDAGRLIQTSIDSFGKIDGLWNNASLYQVGRIDEFEPKEVRLMFDVNITGTVFPAARAVKPMLAQGFGSILNVVSGAQMGIPTMGMYAATKGAVASMTYTWSLELKDRGVRVNALSPLGRTRQQDIQADYDPKVGPAILSNMPPPDAPLPVVAYLLSDRSKHVTGQLVRVDRKEVSLYVHPSLQMPPAVSDDWTVESVANAFELDFKDRLVPSGICGIEGNSAPLQGGFWKRVEAAS